MPTACRRNSGVHTADHILSQWRGSELRAVRWCIEDTTVFSLPRRNKHTKRNWEGRIGEMYVTNKTEMREERTIK